eukprot:CAMPEP_0204610472 /NCGR_PEP_ID=MMETSP0661-20131031/61521_1 /ASSEMBLY_ACC=CAM_ASM_000606 /TAXON_ID=109239 /ORGANISM="Alexandrium margalefi, Strain AMGDE01CS-322" /LENGTH=240 /DNA_ID=CAMNT_0051622283 /DNA_START=821 /DNA_END=1542 /DNA_ORIENTATION=-
MSNAFTTSTLEALSVASKDNGPRTQGQEASGETAAKRQVAHHSLSGVGILGGHYLVELLAHLTALVQEALQPLDLLGLARVARNPAQSLNRRLDPGLVRLQPPADVLGLLQRTTVLDAVCSGHRRKVVGLGEQQPRRRGLLWLLDAAALRRPVPARHRRAPLATALLVSHYVRAPRHEEGSAMPRRARTPGAKARAHEGGSEAEPEERAMAARSDSGAASCAEAHEQALLSRNLGQNGLS